MHAGTIGSGALQAGRRHCPAQQVAKTTFRNQILSCRRCFSDRRPGHLLDLRRLPSRYFNLSIPLCSKQPWVRKRPNGAGALRSRRTSAFVGSVVKAAKKPGTRTAKHQLSDPESNSENELVDTKIDRYAGKSIWSTFIENKSYQLELNCVHSKLSRSRSRANRSTCKS